MAKGITKHTDILQTLLTSQDRMPDEQIRDEMTTLFVAGYETTSQTLAWLFYEVARRPEIAAPIRADMNDQTSGNVTSLIKETMRFYPSVWLMVRKSISPTTLGPYYVPERSIILLNVYSMHHNPLYWERPEEFRPERFSNAIKEQHSNCYFPFGSGPRVCIGQPFAMMLMQIVVSRLVKSFIFKSVPNEARIEAHLTLRAKPAIYVELAPVA